MVVWRRKAYKTPSRYLYPKTSVTGLSDDIGSSYVSRLRSAIEVETNVAIGAADVMRRRENRGAPSRKVLQGHWRPPTGEGIMYHQPGVIPRRMSTSKLCQRIQWTLFGNEWVVLDARIRERTDVHRAVDWIQSIRVACQRQGMYKIAILIVDTKSGCT